MARLHGRPLTDLTPADIANHEQAAAHAALNAWEAARTAAELEAEAEGRA